VFPLPEVFRPIPVQWGKHDDLRMPSLSQFWVIYEISPQENKLVTLAKWAAWSHRNVNQGDKRTPVE
ncbi:hypothetical protein ACQP3J_27515, partial [Escherichia coli]